MYALVLLVVWGNTIAISHVDNFLSKRLCEHAGSTIQKELLLPKNNYSKVEYSCVLEIN
jgi:hypothetical protein